MKRVWIPNKAYEESMLEETNEPTFQISRYQSQHSTLAWMLPPLPTSVSQQKLVKMAVMKTLANKVVH